MTGRFVPIFSTLSFFSLLPHPLPLDPSAEGEGRHAGPVFRVDLILEDAFFRADVPV